MALLVYYNKTPNNTMNTYNYIYKDRTGQVTKSQLQARQIFEALHNARFEVLSHGGDIRGLVISSH